MPHTLLADSDYLSPFERQDYLARLHEYISQVFEGSLALEDVPHQYLDDVITTGFYEYSGHKTTIEQYMRIVFFRSYLRSRHTHESEKVVEPSSP
ncbi:MAG: hypothetical protein HY817_03595 [Candidatus Abawacabacteria bacterium]|nr:hypothetical protein [Candidatus Abawacabacteria bacterium]